MVNPFRIEPDTIDRLVERITFEMAEDGDGTVLRDVLAGQVAIVTRLETENAALVEYHARAERFYRANADAEYRSCPDAGEWLEAENAWRDQAEALATNHGIAFQEQSA